jgi:hypothetical protein
MAVNGTWKRVLLSGSQFTVGQITASNIGATVNGSELIFASSSGEFQTSSFSINDNGDINLGSGELSGSFNGSLSGDGSGLTNISNDFTNALTHGNGISPFSYNGSSGATIKLLLDGGGNSGLVTSSDGLALNDTLAGDGLVWDGNNVPGTTGGGILNVSGGFGILVSGDEVTVDSASIFNTNDFFFSAQGKASIDLTGNGPFTSLSNNFTLIGTNPFSVTPSAAEAFTTSDIDKTISLLTTIPGDRTFANNINIEGDLTVVNSSNVTQIRGSNADLNIEDRFLYLNSGSLSNHNNGGIIVDRGYSGIRSGSAIAYIDGSTGTIAGKDAGDVGWAIYPIFPSDQTSANIVDDDLFDVDNFVDTNTKVYEAAYISTVKHLTNNSPDNTSAAYFYDSNDGGALANYGAFYIDRDAVSEGNESNVFVFVPFDEG